MALVIHPQAARRFLKGYSILLAEVHHLSGDNSEIEMLNMLHKSRAAIVDNPSLIEAAAYNLAADGHAVPEDVVEAIQSLKVKKWVFLRDTAKYSIFIDPDGKDAFAVLGLTQPVRDIVGGTGFVLETGLVRFQNAYACDGIVAKPVLLGANYMQEYADLYKSLKASGRFFLV